MLCPKQIQVVDSRRKLSYAATETNEEKFTPKRYMGKQKGNKDQPLRASASRHPPSRLPSILVAPLNIQKRV